MANLTIQQPEIIFLQDAVIRKYCELIRENPLVYRKKLTGTMKHYIDIAENILDYLDNDRLRAYTASIGDGPFRTALRRLLEEEGRTGRSKESQWRPVVTDNVVRKLLFADSEKQPELTFKDFFIVAFYIYIDADRTDVLQQLGESPAHVREGQTAPAADGKTTRDEKTAADGKTIRPEQYETAQQPSSNSNTIDPYRSKMQCTLRPLDQDSKPGEALEFTYNGSPIVLNRMNLDPQNNTITSKVQAQLSVTGDGRWVIENFSELKTTYIKVIKPMPIEKGDIIVFGNKQFLVD